MQLIAQTDERKVLKINKPCKLYGAQKDRILAPFNPGNDMDRLVLLREIKEIDIPKGSGKPPQPLKISCGLLGEKTSRSIVMNQARQKPEKYNLHCSTP
ncbi:MAG: hypothetical protein KJ630_02075 [Proteobacteria bacterium]|nr:hypothetical protein [Pseudomonadota bacterium]